MNDVDGSTSIENPGAEFVNGSVPGQPPGSKTGNNLNDTVIMLPPHWLAHRHDELLRQGTAQQHLTRRSSVHRH